MQDKIDIKVYELRSAANVMGAVIVENGQLLDKMSNKKKTLFINDVVSKIYNEMYHNSQYYENGTMPKGIFMF